MGQAQGGCRCGAVRMIASGAPYRVGVCHCLDCRKFHGAPFCVAAICADAAVLVTGATQHIDNRHFCPTCGSPVFSRSDDEIEISLGCFDEPDRFVPNCEIWTIRRESWLPPFPNMRRYERNRTGGARSEP